MKVEALQQGAEGKKQRLLRAFIALRACRSVGDVGSLSRAWPGLKRSDLECWLV